MPSSQIPSFAVVSKNLEDDQICGEEVEVEDEETYVNQYKLDMPSSQDILPYNENSVVNDPSHIWNSSSISVLLMYTLCPMCKIGKLDVKYTYSGMSTKALLICTRACGFSRNMSLDYENKKQEINEFNEKAVIGALNGGASFTVLKRILTQLNLKCMTINTFSRIARKIAEKTVQEAEDMFNEVAKTIRNTYMNLDDSIKNNDIIDISVSYENSWQNKGHSSLYGIGIVTELQTGLIIDYEKYSLDCNNYNIIPLRTKGTSDRNNDSVELEMAGAEAMWKRSISKYKFRYSSVISNGNEKLVNNLNLLKVYDVPIHLEATLNHFHRRIVSEFKNNIKCKSYPSGHLSLQDIDTLGQHFSEDIVQNNQNLPGMDNHALASFHHFTSTDDEFNHDWCSSSKCFFKQAFDEDKDPGSHSQMELQISEEIASDIEKVYLSLCKPDLLSRCQKSKDTNMTFHSLIWHRCKLTSSQGNHAVQYAISSSILNYNIAANNSLDQLISRLKFARVSHSPNKSKRQANKKQLYTKNVQYPASEEVQNNKKIKLDVSEVN